MVASSSVALPDQTALTISRHGTVRQVAAPSHTPDPAALLGFFVGQEWRNQAACLGVPTDLFFPERGIPGERIRDLCFSCPVRLDCLEDSVTAMPKFGWAGGHPKEGRTRIRELLAQGYDLETADAITLSDSLEKVRQRKKAEKTRRYDRTMGEPILGEVTLAS